MATFSDFVRLHEKGEIKRITYACGEEQVLVEEVVDAIRWGVDPGDENFISLTAGEVPEREIWAALNQYPLDPTDKRLVLVRDAERLKEWPRLTDWVLSRQMPNVYALLVSSLDDWPYKWEQGADGKRVKTFVAAEVRDRVQKSGRLTLCNLPKDVERREEQAAKIIMGWGAISLRTAQYLYRRVGGDLVECRDAMNKASLFSGEVTERVVDFMTTRTAAQDYVTAVLGRQSGVAATLAESVPAEQHARIVAQLESDLLLCARINRAQKRAQTTQQLVSTLGEHRLRVDNLRRFAKHYDAEKMSSCVSALSLADKQVRMGVRVGVLEMLACTW